MSRRLLLAAGAAVVVVLAAWYLLLWRPAGNDLAAADERYEVARSTNAELRSQIARLQERELEAPALQSELNVLRAAIPEEPQEAELLLILDDAAVESGVSLLSVTTSDPVADPSGLGSFQAQVLGSGGYFQVLDFLNRIAATQRIILVDTLSLAAVEAADEIGPPDLSWSFTLRALTTAPPEEVGAVEGAPVADAATEPVAEVEEAPDEVPAGEPVPDTGEPVGDGTEPVEVVE